MYPRLIFCSAVMVFAALGSNWASATDAEPSQASGARAPGGVFHRLRALDWKSVSETEYRDITNLVSSDSSAIHEALEYLRQAPDNQRFPLGRLLAETRSPIILETALKWRDDVTDDNLRAVGWGLLRSWDGHPESVALAIRSLGTERSARVLAQSIWLARRIGVPDPTDEASISRRLHRLTRHPSPGVRVASIQMLADWDRTGRYVVRDLIRLLGDDDVEVRLAAVGAASMHAQSPSSLKTALLRRAIDAREDPDVRRFALVGLERYGFTPWEYAQYKRAEESQSRLSSGQN